uniref:Uncharacterized protein n=1 Tax=Oryza nivara TaxID=4536 RepID=A0A0E0G448_ORYNI
MWMRKEAEDERTSGGCEETAYARTGGGYAEVADHYGWGFLARPTALPPFSIAAPAVVAAPTAGPTSSAPVTFRSRRADCRLDPPALRPLGHVREETERRIEKEE